MKTRAKRSLKGNKANAMQKGGRKIKRPLSSSAWSLLPFGSGNNAQQRKKRANGWNEQAGEPTCMTKIVVVSPVDAFFVFAVAVVAISFVVVVGKRIRLGTPKMDYNSSSCNNDASGYRKNRMDRDWENGAQAHEKRPKMNSQQSSCSPLAGGTHSDRSSLRSRISSVHSTCCKRQDSALMSFLMSVEVEMKWSFRSLDYLHHVARFHPVPTGSVRLSARNIYHGSSHGRTHQGFSHALDSMSLQPRVRRARNQKDTSATFAAFPFSRNFAASARKVKR